MPPVAGTAELQVVQSELDLAVADAIRQAATRSEHIRLTRIAVLIAKLKSATATPDTQP